MAGVTEELDFKFYLILINLHLKADLLNGNFKSVEQLEYVNYFLIFIYLFIYGCVGSSFLCEGFL